MKRLLLVMLALLAVLMPTVSVAETYQMDADVNILTVGVDMPAGDYRVHYVGSSRDWNYGIYDGDGNTVVPPEIIRVSESTTKYVTLLDGYRLTTYINDDGIIKVTSALPQAKEIAEAADPYNNIIQGVKMKDVIRQFEQYYIDNPIDAGVHRVSVSYTDKPECFMFSIRYNDGVDISGYTEYIPEILRKFNTLCYIQNTSIATASPTSYGGVFDMFEAYVCAYHESTVLSGLDIISTIVPAGSHGYANIDTSTLE